MVKLIDEVYLAVKLQSDLRQSPAESFVNKSTIINDEARQDIKANGLWGSRFKR